MKAMVLEEYGKPLILRDVPQPEPDLDEVLVRVRACGLCGTDLKIASGKLPWIKLPHIMGHEISGEIVKIGQSVKGVQPGDRVVAYIYVTCGRCANCLNGYTNICTGEIQRIGFERPGGFAEYVAIPVGNLFKLPENIAYEQAAILPDAVVTTLHAIRYKASVTAMDVVMVFGIGGLGAHAVQLAKIFGARTIAADIRPASLELARQFGVDAVIDARQGQLVEEVKRLTNGEGVDVVLDNVGSPESLNVSLQMLKRGGRVVSVGYSPDRPVPIDTFAMHYNEWQLMGTRNGTKLDLLDSIAMVGSGRLKPWVGELYPFDAANEALELLRRGQVVGRIVLRM